MNRDAYTRFGKKGEEAIATWLRTQGYYVVRAADIQGPGAPMLEGARSGVVLPDVLASFRGKSMWVEIKTKSCATWHRGLRRYEHGLEERNWNCYLEVELQTGIPGYLCIYELEAGMVLVQSMKVLNTVKRCYRGPNMPGGQPHVYFPRDRFEWYSGPDYGDEPFARINRPDPIRPQAPRTLTQKPAPTTKQLGMWEEY